MENKQHLTGRKAIDKIKELAEDKTCMFCTYENNQVVSRPMSTQRIDDDGSIWFLSRKDSNKNLQIVDNHAIYLMYLDTGKQHYLSLNGTARILYDRDLVNDLWTPIAKAWFTEGKDDPEITVIKVSPDGGHYWDTRNGKLVSMVKIAAAAILGNEMDGGVDGDISV
jgi:general stress protein 26